MIFDLPRIISDSKSGNMALYTGSTEIMRDVYFQGLIHQLAKFQKEYGSIKMRYKPPGIIEIDGRLIYLELFDSPKRKDVVNEEPIYKYIVW